MYDGIKSRGIAIAKRLRRAAITQVVFACASTCVSLSVVSNVLSIVSGSIALSILGSDPAAAFADGQFNSTVRGIDIAIIVLACFELAGAAVVWGTNIAPNILRQALYAIGIGSLNGYTGTTVIAGPVFAIEWLAIALIGSFAASLINVATASASLVFYDQYEDALEDVASTLPEDFVVAGPPQGFRVSPRREPPSAREFAALGGYGHDEESGSESPMHGVSPLRFMAPTSPLQQQQQHLASPGPQSGRKPAPAATAQQNIRQQYAVYASPQSGQWQQQQPQYPLQTPQRPQQLLP